MTIKKVLFTLLFVLSSSLTFAQNEIVGMGAGTSTCKEMLDFVKSGKGAEKDSAMLLFDSWMTGYMSGRNAQLNALNYEMIDFTKSRKLANKLLQTCENENKRGNGKKLIMLVAEEIFEEAFNKNLQKKQ